MKLWLVLTGALVMAGPAAARGASRAAALEGWPTHVSARVPVRAGRPAARLVAQALLPARQAPGQAAAQARSDSLARAALEATTPRRRVFVDVRTPAEFEAGHLSGAINLPLGELPQRWPELKAYAQRQIVLYCRSGHRAGLALELVTQHGIRNAWNGGGYESLRRLLAGPRR